MRIKNIELLPLIAYLDTFTLISTESRMRTRLKKILIDKLQLFDSERQELVKQFSRKDENGNPLTKINEDGEEVGDIEEVNEFQREYAILGNELIYIEETIGNRQMLLTVRDIVAADSTGYKGAEADNYDYWCQCFEAINYDDEGDE